MSGNDEQVECPLCMEPLEIDDINFFPCTCGYQICRFCWHRIRTDENGLCPACRKAYPEDPAKFNPLTEDELQRIKKERRQKDLQRKQKAAENRKHLANVRVVQRNLVFVVGLSARLADAEVLKKHEYFGKFGKIHKVVINQSTSYAGAQGPSASAYVTYNRPEDALKAIIAANNVHIDGRTLKASLGTTKYCSHFLRGTQCPKTDCMYLHELGEEQASFTKEEMQVGKHQEYEQRLLEQYMNSQNTAHNHSTNNKIASTSRKKTGSPITMIQPSQSPPQTTQMPSPPIPPQTNSTPRQNTQAPPSTSNKDAWPSLHSSGGTSKPEKPLTNGIQSPQTDRSPDKNKTDPTNKAPGKHRPQVVDTSEQSQRTQEPPASVKTEKPPVSTPSPRQQTQQNLINSMGNKRKSLGLDSTDNLSLFSSTNGFNGVRNPKPVSHEQPAEVPTTEIPDTIPVSSATDWSEAFGFGQSSSTSSKDWQDDDLGFDPLEESSRGLADLLEKENGQKISYSNMYETQKFAIPHSRQIRNNLSHNLPPGFSVSHIQQQSNLMSSQSSASRTTLPSFSTTDVLSSRMMGFMTPQQPAYQDMFSDLSLLAGHKESTPQNHSQSDGFNMKDWQDGLRALLPNINISFGSQQAQQQQQQMDSRTAAQHSNGQKSSAPLQDPHWLKSINQLTDLESTSRRLPFVQQFPVRNTVWPPQTHNPPPGFQSHIRPPLQKADPHTLAEGLQ